jgi:hypothetical protein
MVIYYYYYYYYYSMTPHKGNLQERT